MRKSLLFLFIIMTNLVFSSCFTMGLNTGFGPQGVFFSSTTQGVSSTGKIEGPIIESACVHSLGIIIFGIATWGDGSAEKAAINSNTVSNFSLDKIKSGTFDSKTGKGITNIYTVDKKGFNLFNVYTNLCTVITGDNLPIVGSPTSATTPAGDPAFTDIVVLKNGDILEGVKTVVTANELIVTDSKGNTTVYKKKEVLSVKKKR